MVEVEVVLVGGEPLTGLLDSKMQCAGCDGLELQRSR